MEINPSTPEDPMLGPKVPYNPEDFGYFPDALEEHRDFIESTEGDLTLFLLMESARNLERLRDTQAAYPDLEERLRSFHDRIALRKAFLGGS